MQWFTNIEGVVMLGFGMVCAAAFAGVPAAPVADTPHAGARGAAVAAPPIVVLVTAKRLTPAEKRAFDLQKQS